MTSMMPITTAQASGQQGQSQHAEHGYTQRDDAGGHPE